MERGDDDGLGDLFEDLEQQAAGIEIAERDAELADRVRGEYAVVALGDRIHASRGREVALVLHGGEVVEGALVEAGRGWCAVRPVSGVTWVVRLGAIAVARGLSPRALPGAVRPAVARLGLGSALHRFADDAGRLHLQLVTGSSWEARMVRAGADFLEVVPLTGAGAPTPALVAFDALRAARLG